jgi:hypothetical protein
MYFAGKGMKTLLQKTAKGNEQELFKNVMQVIFGTISGPHLECVQRFLFVLIHSG